jgi:hypothetical protein
MCAILFVVAAAATAAIAIELATKRQFADNQAALETIKQTPEGPLVEVGPERRGTFDLKRQEAYDHLASEFGVPRDRINYMTEVNGWDDKENHFAVNSSPIMDFPAPYVIATADDLAAWARDPEGALMSEPIAKSNGWKPGDAFKIHSANGDISGRVAAIVRGTARKVFFHPAQLEKFMPPELRDSARFIGIMIRRADYRRLQQPIEDMFERLETPSWFLDCHDILDRIFRSDSGLHIVAGLALVLSLTFVVCLVSVPGIVSATGWRFMLLTWLACAGGVGLAARELHARYAHDGLKVSFWFLSSVEIGGGILLRAGGAVLAGALVLFAASRLWMRAAHGWIVVLIVAMVPAAVSAAAIVAYRSVDSLTAEGPAAVGAPPAERFDFVENREPGGAIRSFVLRGTSVSGLVAHGARVEGRFPAPKERGVVVGAALLALDPGLAHGSLIVGRHRWPVTGVLRAKHSIHESEVWCDLAALTDEQSLSPPGDKVEAPSVAPRLDDYRRAFIGSLVVLLLASALAIVAAGRRLRAQARLRPARVGAALFVAIGVLVAAFVAAGGPVTIGSPVLIARLRFDAVSVLAVAAMAAALVVLLLVASRGSQEVSRETA